MLNITNYRSQSVLCVDWTCTVENLVHCTILLIVIKSTSMCHQIIMCQQKSDVKLEFCFRGSLVLQNMLFFEKMFCMERPAFDEKDLFTEESLDY